MNTYKYHYNRTLLRHAHSAKTNQTNIERLLWFHLRNRQFNGYKFRRQYPIHNYILDFYCVECKIAVEVDGSQHMQRKAYDDERSLQLSKLGIHLLRFWNNEVLENLDSVLEQILTNLEAVSSKNLTLPSPKRRG